MGGVFFFFFNDTATTEIYTLSLHDALPISPRRAASVDFWRITGDWWVRLHRSAADAGCGAASECGPTARLRTRAKLERSAEALVSQRRCPDGDARGATAPQRRETDRPPAARTRHESRLRAGPGVLQRLVARRADRLGGRTASARARRKRFPRATRRAGR